MVPDVAKKGHSFNGAFAYYLHDKGPDGQHLTTAARVGWTETRNLATDDPHLAKRIMIATASQADELKAAAGIKATGRKSNAHVYAYSLAWHPDEAAKLDRAEMVRAVDQSLKALEADHLQAVIVCHTDQKHPHVHVILNRVDPETGKMHGFSNDRRKLSDWANTYERERGVILTPLREEKRQEREAPAPQRDRRSDTGPSMAPSEAAILKALTDDQKARHKREWPELSAQNKASQEAIYSDYDERIKTLVDVRKELNKPIWAQYFRQARDDLRAFEVREKSLIGIVRNAIETTAHQHLNGRADGRGVLAMTFQNILSSQARVAAFTEKQDGARGKLATQLRQELNAEIAKMKTERSAALTAQRVAFGKARADLIDKQDAERAKIREAWKQVYERKAREGGTRQKPRAYPRKESPVRDNFDEARRLKVGPNQVAPTKDQALRSPAPAPAPAGMAPPAPPRSQTVPNVDRVKDWAKTPEGRAHVEKQSERAAPAVRDYWSKAAPASPAQPTPAEREQKAESAPAKVRDYWSEAAKPHADRTPVEKTRDRDFDRDR